MKIEDNESAWYNNGNFPAFRWVNSEHSRWSLYGGFVPVYSVGLYVLVQAMCVGSILVIEFVTQAITEIPNLS